MVRLQFDPPRPSPGVGDAVTHAKFGPGVVLAREGAGDHAKLTIDFADAQRQLLAKFVRRA